MLLEAGIHRRKFSVSLPGLPFYVSQPVSWKCDVSQLFVGNAKLSEASVTQLAPGHFLSFWDL